MSLRDSLILVSRPGYKLPVNVCKFAIAMRNRVVVVFVISKLNLLVADMADGRVAPEDLLLLVIVKGTLLVEQNTELRGDVLPPPRVVPLKRAAR